MPAAIHPSDIAIDHQLADATSSIRFLLDVTPVNLIEARNTFLSEGTTPEFVYGPLADDPAVIETRLAAIAIEAVEDAALAGIVASKRHELELQLRMLRCRGSEEFLELSVQLYGPVSPALVGEAEALLTQVPPPRTEGGDRLEATAFARLAEAELALYRAVHPDLSVRVELRDDSSGVMVSNGNLLIAPTAVVPSHRVYALLQHEIGTHIVTHVNGSSQPLRLLGAGLAGYDETQEGLAVLAEHLAGGFSARRLRQLAARVVAVHQMCAGEKFPTVHRYLLDSGVSRREAFTITMRVFRSGGLTKDAVYLRGLRDVIAYVGAGGDLEVLWLGKMALSDVPHLVALRDRGVLVDPVLVPRYMSDPMAQERLAKITARTVPIDLIGAAA